MPWISRVGFVLLICIGGGSALGGCALGPVPARQRAEAQTDVPRDHPHPPPHLAGVPLDGSTDKLYCYQDGPDTVCHRQAAP